MHNVKFKLTLFSYILTIILAACNLPSSDQSTTPDQDAPSGSTATSPATSPTDTQTSQSSETASQTPETSTGPNDAAQFGGDVTIPDYTPIEAGQAFTKTWRMQNAGETTWTTEYTLEFADGDKMNGPDSIPFPSEVAPGDLVDLSVDLTAPQDPGTYTGFWVLKNADGVPFSTPDDEEYRIFVIIRVVAEGTDTDSGTPLEDGVTITAATLSIANPNYSGSCPVTLNFSGVISSSGTGSLVYTLVPSSQTPGFTWYPLGSFTLNFNTDGTHSSNIFYDLTIEDSVTGSIYLQVTGANIRSSNTINLNITCND